MTTQSPLRMLAIVSKPDDVFMAAGSALSRYAAEGIDITLIGTGYGQTREPAGAQQLLGSASSCCSAMLTTIPSAACASSSATFVASDRRWC